MKVKITKRTVDAAAPGKRDAFLWDTELTGFGCKITPAGKRVYIVQYRFAGRLRRYTIGKHGAPWTPEEARLKASRVLGDGAAGLDPAETKALGRTAPTLAELADRYLGDHAIPHKKPLSVEEDRRNLRLHVLPALGRRKVADVTRADVINLHRALRHTPVAANRVIALLSKMLNLSEKWGLRPDGTNPCRHVEKYKERTRERFLTTRELAQLGDALTAAEREGFNPVAVAAIRLLVMTGARKSEILTLRWEWVDFEHSCLRLPDSKTGAKVVPLGAPALELLASLPRVENNPHVLPGEKADGHFVGLQKAWERMRKRAGLDDVRVHDFRHSFASVAVAGGESLYLVGKVLGHRQVRTTERYAHMRDDPLRAVADRTAGHIAAAMNGGDGGAEVVALPKRKA